MVKLLNFIRIIDQNYDKQICEMYCSRRHNSYVYVTTSNQYIIDTFKLLIICQSFSFCFLLQCFLYHMCIVNQQSKCFFLNYDFIYFFIILIAWLSIYDILINQVRIINLLSTCVTISPIYQIVNSGNRGRNKVSPNYLSYFV